MRNQQKKAGMNLENILELLKWGIIFVILLIAVIGLSKWIGGMG